jgi:AraC-like DNA-binding protein
VSSPFYPKIYLSKTIVQARRFIDDNYAENIDLNNIADEPYFSKFHFIRLFTKIYGKTPHQYSISVRIVKARQLLRSDMPVSSVCYTVGFESASSFSPLFKKIVGVAPSAYLFQQQQIKAQILKSPLNFIPGCFAEKNQQKEKNDFTESTQ